MKRLLIWLPLCLAATTLPAAENVIFSDTWADGDLADGPDATDIAWYTTTTSSAIEVGSGFMGLVSGTSGRGIHTVFDPVTLAVGDSLTVTGTFNTPDTVALGDGRTSAFRVAFFNTNGIPAAQDYTASRVDIWEQVTGYMTDFDVNSGEEDISFRERLPDDGTDNAHRLLSTTSNFEVLGGEEGSGGEPYSFFDNATYTVTFTLTLTDATTLTLHASLAIGDMLLSEHSQMDVDGWELTFDMLAFHSNSNTFGSVADRDTPDNGIDFTEVTLVSKTGETGGEDMGPGVLSDFARTGDNVNTMDWVGWLDVSAYPWVYSYSLAGWAFINEDGADANGAWFYLAR